MRLQICESDENVLNILTKTTALLYTNYGFHS